MTEREVLKTVGKFVLHRGGNDQSSQRQGPVRTKESPSGPNDNMRRRIIILTIGWLSFAGASSSQGGVIANWDFDTPPTYTGVVPYAANSLDPANLLRATLTTVIAPHSDSTTGAGAGNPGTALQFITKANGNGKEVNGCSFVLTLTTPTSVSLSSFSITYDYLATDVGGSGAQNDWTVSGGSGFSAQSTTISQDGNWHTITVNFTGGTVAANSTITFTDTLSSYATGNSFIAAFDNIQVSAVPEPVNVALGIFGLGAVGAGAGRRLYLRMRA